MENTVYCSLNDLRTFQQKQAETNFFHQAIDDSMYIISGDVVEKSFRNGELHTFGKN